LELYLVIFQTSWVEAGIYHYDRPGHHLSQLARGADKDAWLKLVPPLAFIAGGALLWVLCGDYGRVAEKYGERGFHFLALEAGHLMQNLCLLSASLGLATVPLGGYFENEVAEALALPPRDVVLYIGLCGKPIKEKGGAARVPGIQLKKAGRDETLP
jgi:SagB-type dehydrogenase family enzyme